MSTPTRLLEVVSWDVVRSRFVTGDFDEREIVITELYSDGLDDIIIDLLYLVDDPRERCKLNPFQKYSCAYDEIIDDEMWLKN